MKHGISIAMIVSDEEECIKQAIDSVQDLADEIVVLMDCNSKDKTREILEGCNKVKLYENKYQGKFDFSVSRNKSLKKCQYAWTFILDGDEILECEDIKELRQAILLLPTNYALRVRVRQAVGRSLSELEQYRCFATRRSGKYAGSPHNQFEFDYKQMRAESLHGCSIKHIGFGDPEKRKRRLTRTEELLPEVLQKIENNEANQNDYYNACKMYQVLDNYKDAIDVGRKGIDYFITLSPEEQRAINRFLLTFGTALMGEGQWDEIERLMKQHIRIVGETVDNQFYLFCWNYREGKMISAFMNALKYLELMEIEKRNPVNMQATLVYKDIMMDKIKMLRYFMAKKMEM